LLALIFVNCAIDLGPLAQRSRAAGKQVSICFVKSFRADALRRGRSLDIVDDPSVIQPSCFAALLGSSLRQS